MRSPPRVPSSSLRGSVKACACPTVSTLIAPETCVRTSVVSSSVGSPGRTERAQQPTEATGPIRAIAWSTAWMPRS